MRAKDILLEENKQAEQIFAKNSLRAKDQQHLRKQVSQKLCYYQQINQKRQNLINHYNQIIKQFYQLNPIEAEQAERLLLKKGKSLNQNQFQQQNDNKRQNYKQNGISTTKYIKKGAFKKK